MARVAVNPRRSGKAGSSPRQSLRVWRFPESSLRSEEPSAPAAPASPVRSSCPLAASTDGKPDNQPNDKRNAARPVRVSLGHGQKRVVEKIGRCMEAGDQPMVVFPHERCSPSRLCIQFQAIGQFVALPRATEGHPVVSAVQARKFIPLHLPATPLYSPV